MATKKDMVNERKLVETKRNVMQSGKGNGV